MPGGGQIGGGGSVYAKFHVGNPAKPISEAEVFDRLAKGEITFIFPPRGSQFRGNRVTVTVPKKSRTRVMVKWR